MGPIAIVINGVPRSGKTTLAGEIMARTGGDWSHMGVDSMMAQTPEHLQPGIGLRPGGERPDLEPFIRSSYQQLFNEIAENLRAGTNVVVDVGIHDGYSQRLDILGEMQRALDGLDVLFVGLHCSLDALRTRRNASGYLSWQVGEPVPDPISRWQRAIHAGKHYDLELDTTAMPASTLAVAVLRHSR